jgi:hypothetical protein
MGEMVEACADLCISLCIADVVVGGRRDTGGVVRAPSVVGGF